MHFQTQVPLKREANQIDHRSEIFSVGSCFAVNIAEKFEYFGFRNTVNPFGILFNPVAIERFLESAVNLNCFNDDDVFAHNSRWHCFDSHSELSHAEKDKLIEALNHAAGTTCEAIRQSSHIIITLGTSWVYRHISGGNIVANCYKLPQSEFAKELLSVQSLYDSLMRTISLITSVNPKAAIIFTVSPVRHFKDGFVGNQRSKANLISALHQVLEQKSGCHYFPSYEIMNDELRDYRFYADDMIHPSTSAVNYIWERFSESWISETSASMMKEIDSVRKSLQHRAFDADSEDHRNFVEKLEQRKRQIRELLPHVIF